MVTADVINRCDYYCGERCGLSLRRWVIRRVPRDSPGAAAPAAASAEAGATPRARAAAALAGAGYSSGAPAVGAALPSDDLATWARQVEAELARVHARLDEKIAEISATTSSSREVAAACADQVANSDIILRQFVENNSGRVASRDDGDAHEWQRQKA